MLKTIYQLLLPSDPGPGVHRGVAERSNAAVLKTVEPQGSGGSNPSSSANQIQNPAVAGFFVGKDSSQVQLEREGEANKKARSDFAFDLTLP